MAFHKQTLRDYDLHGKRVLVRADFNVPMNDDGSVRDDYRITQAIPTLQYLLEQACSIVIISHLGRPKGPQDTEFSLEPAAKRLSEAFNREVKFAHDTVGDDAKAQVDQLQPGDILVLENLRFHPEEKANDDDFAQQLAQHGEVFVQDGFGVVHRAHASTDAITRHLPSVAGLLLEREYTTISDAMHEPERPLMAIVGGAKVSDKIEVLHRFVDTADIVAVGGAMSNVFLHIHGVSVAKSKFDAADVPLAEELLQRVEQKKRETNFVFYVPQDGVAAKKIDVTAHTRIVDWSSHVFADISAYPNKPSRSAVELEDDDMLLDIGPYSGAFIAGAMQLAKTVVWNGAMGVTEVNGVQGPIGPFAHGTETLVEAISGQRGNKPYSIVGGGDTVGYLESLGMLEAFNHVSTGGGASLELMSGKALPGVEALRDKQ